MLWLIAIAVVIVWGIGRFYLRGEDLSKFDEPRDPPVVTVETPSAEHQQVVDALASYGLGEPEDRKTPRRARLAEARRRFDDYGTSFELDVAIEPVTADGVAAEWVMAPGADPNFRVLYLHGGAFAIGSPRSHRTFTAKFSHMLGASVLAIDYRLMPEHPRLASVDDTRTAYRWILANGPRGPAEVSKLVVAGDSAGGNLTLMVVAWARDEGLRPADAVVAMSPATDGTFTSPSLRRNIETDAMLGPTVGRFAKVPHVAMLWMSWLTARRRPCDPSVSPVHGDLSGLPAILLHASESELLIDEVRRYANKARLAGSPVRLETWPNTMHVWHGFVQTVPEAREAFTYVAQFLANHVDSGAQPPS
ncbi:MAG: alpha/beta hydrolase [Gammaproteobacteria bacterium]|nr:alpha/beta hydrolase [Gammaproteobacteria bacterium]